MGLLGGEIEKVEQQKGFKKSFKKLVGSLLPARAQRRVEPLASQAMHFKHDANGLFQLSLLLSFALPSTQFECHFSCKNLMKITKRYKPIILQFQTDLDMKRSYKRKSQFWTQLLETVMLWIAAKREENSSFYLSKKDRSSKFPKAIKRFYVRMLFCCCCFSLSPLILSFLAFLQFS